MLFGVLDQNDVLLPPPVMCGVLLDLLLCYSKNLSQRCMLLLRHMPIMHWVLSRWGLLFQSWACHSYFMLVFDMLLAFYFQVLMLPIFPAVGDQPLRFVLLHPFGGYQWQAYLINVCASFPEISNHVSVVLCWFMVPLYLYKCNYEPKYSRSSWYDNDKGHFYYIIL